MARAPTNAELNRRVRICAQDDVVVDGTMRMRREGVRTVAARIEPLAAGSSFTADGRNIEDRPTHRVTIRTVPDIDLTRTAWLYEERRVSQGRWYKVVRISESADCKWWELRVFLDQRTDECVPSENTPDRCDQRQPNKSLARPVKL